MKSPFAIFRKHQKVLMVVLTGLAMFAFVILDSLSQNMALIPPVFGFALGMAIAWALTRKLHYSTGWMLVGGIVGAMLGSQLQATTAASEAVVETSFASLSEQELAEVNNRQQMVNSFLIEAFQRANEGNPNPSNFQLQQALFGGNGDPNREALMHLLMIKEAEKIDLDISQTQVKAYIDNLTENKLSGRAFREITTRLGLSGEDLFDLLREQMIAREVSNVLMPRVLATPDDYWTAYQQLNVRQELTVVPIAAETFLDQVGEPTEDELKTLFEEYKDKFPNETEPGSPGFRQPVRIKLGYLEIDYDQVQESLPEITDEEVEAYYEANKEQFRNDVPPVFPTEQPAESNNGENAPAEGNGPALMPQGGNDAEGSNEPGSAKQPESSDMPAENNGGEENASPAEKPAAEAGKPEQPASTDAPGENAPESNNSESTGNGSEPEATPEPEQPEGDSSEEQSSLMVRPLGRAFASIQQEAPAEEGGQPAEQPESASNEEEKPADSAEKSEVPAEKPAENGSADSPEATETDKPAASEDKPEMQPEAGGETAEDKPAAETESAMPAEEETPEAPLPEFRELDDDLRTRIREDLKNQKTRTKMAEIIRQARGEMLSINAKYAVAPEGEVQNAAEEIRKEAQAYAKKHQMRYVETPFLSPSEMEESEDHPLGSSTEPVTDDFQRADAMTVVDQHFSVSDIEELERQQYQLFEAEDPRTGNRFVHWQIAFRESHVPTWDEEGIQEQVRETWLNVQAQELAQKRADEVLKMLKESDKPWSEALEGVTETGKEGGQTLVVSYTGPFSWLSQSSVPQTNFAPRPLEITQIPIIAGGVDRKFMETVFFELNEGEVGTVWGADHRYVYVVKPENRTETQTAQEDFLGPQTNLFSFMSPYPRLAQAESQSVARRWLDALYEQYEVKWKGEEDSEIE